MPTVSGRLQYDATRSSASATTNTGIANVAIVLQNTDNGMMAAVLTDNNGNFEFTDVPNGDYQLVESYGTPATVVGTIDWAASVVYADIINGGTVPPLADENYTYVAVPIGSTITNLDCTMRNTRLLPGLASNLTGQDFLNGPVRITPMAIPANIILDPTNLVTAADNGTFGSFAAGSLANTGAGVYPANQGPYPEINSSFLYSQPDSSQVTPADGHYTVQNIINNAWSNTHPTTANPAWWRVADHTFGNEMGRMMVINGYTAGTLIGETTVNVLPNSTYLTSYWILNLCRQPSGYINPEFSVNILDDDGNIIFQHDFSDEIGVNVECPEWSQIGTIFNTEDNTSVTVQFISQGGAATGNDYVLDDVALNLVEVLELDITKDVSCVYATVGGTIYYQISIANNTDYVATQVALTDVLAYNFNNVQFTLDGVNWQPWVGSLNIDDLQPGDSGDVIIRGTVRAGTTGSITNTATVECVFCPVV